MVLHKIIEKSQDIKLGKSSNVIGWDLFDS